MLITFIGRGLITQALNICVAKLSRIKTSLFGINWSTVVVRNPGMPWPVKQAKCSAIAFAEPIILAINYLQSRRENVDTRLTFVSKSDTRRNIL